MQKITPFLWFNDNAEEAVNFYLSIFKNSELVTVTRYEETGPGPKGSIMTVVFKLNGVDFIALNGGPQFTFSPAVSFVVNCRDQAEIDNLWERLSEGGQKRECGWLTDRYGLCWQIVPEALGKMLAHADAETSNRIMAAILQMRKFDIAQLEQAHSQYQVR